MAARVRSITEGDIRGYFTVLHSVVEEEEYLIFNPGEISFDKARDFALAMIKRNAPMFVAEDDGNIVGWCDVTPKEHEKEKHVGELGIGVAKEYRAKGIGTLLLDAALTAAKQYGLEKVHLHVFATNARAIEFYKRYGFVEEGIEHKAAKIRGTHVDRNLMAKFL